MSLPSSDVSTTVTENSGVRGRDHQPGVTFHTPVGSQLLSPHLHIKSYKWPFYRLIRIANRALTRCNQKVRTLVELKNIFVVHRYKNTSSPSTLLLLKLYTYASDSTIAGNDFIHGIFGILLRRSVVFTPTVSMSSNLFTFRAILNCRNSQKSQGAMSGEQSLC